MTSCPLCSSVRVAAFCQAVDRVLPSEGTHWTILHCESCGYGWTFPPLSEDAIAGFYPRTYLGDTRRMLDEYGAGRLQSSRSWRKEIEKVKLVEKYVTRGRILDVGCGDARFLLALDARRWEAWGVEFNSPVVDMVAEAFPKLHLVAGDLFSRNLSPGSFDVVCFWHVLEHLPRPFDVLSQVAALLKPGGLVFVSLPNLESLQARLFRRFWYGFDDVPRHLHHFSPRVLAGLLSRVGLQVMDGPLFFCRIVNAHCLKHSLVNWSEGTFRSRVPYLLLKPFVLTLPALERMVRSYGIVTMVGRRG